MTRSLSDYAYGDATPSCTASYVWPPTFDILETEALSGASIFDLGCGNGAFAAALADRGYDVTGVDPSEKGIEQAQQAYPGLNLHVGSAYDDLTDQFGQFPVVTSLEVIEHVYDPYRYAGCVFDLLERGGGSGALHPLPRIPQEPGDGNARPDRHEPLQPPLDTRPHQDLVA